MHPIADEVFRSGFVRRKNVHQRKSFLPALGSVFSIDENQCYGTLAHTATGIHFPRIVTHVSMLIPDFFTNTHMFPSTKDRTLRYQDTNPF